MSSTLSIVGSTKLRMSVEEEALREAEKAKALEVFKQLLEAHFDRAVETKADEVFKISFALTFERAFTHTDVKAKVSYSRKYTDEDTRFARSAQQQLLLDAKPNTAN
jgi:hypothetical protein